MRKIAFAVLAALTLTACEGATTSYSSDSRNRVMDISNSTGVTMTNFYASRASRNEWGRDHLGTTVLRSGKYFTKDFSDGTSACLFDFKAVFADGDVLTASDVNVCAETGWNYH